MNESELKRIIGNRLKTARESTPYSQQDIAEMLGIERVSYSHIEAGRNLIRIDYLIKLSVILNRPITYFLNLPNSQGLNPEESEIVHLYRALGDEVRRLIRVALRAWLQAAPPPVPPIRMITAEPELPPGIDRALFERVEKIMTRLTDEERYLLLETLLNRRAARMAGETPKEIASLDSQ